MKVNPVLVMVVAVLVSSTVECGEAIDSEELCEQIRSNELDILTMGTRGKSFDDAHFYILVEGGYMFKVPLANLRVHAENKTTSITIDRNYIRADALLNVSQDLFTRQNRFFLISNQNQDAFLGRMFFCQEHSQRAFQLYDLSGALSIWNHSQDIYEQETNRPIHVMASVGIDSNIAHGFGLFGNLLLYWQFSYEVHNKDELKVKKSPNLGRYLIEFQNNSETVTVFYHQENPKKEDGYYYFLDSNGLVTVSRRKNASDFASSYGEIKDLCKDSFEVNLSSFVACHFKHSANTRINWTYWIIALCIGIFAVLGGLAIYFYVGMKKEKAKRRDLKKKNKSYLSSFASSNLSSSNVNSSNVNSSSISSGTSSSNASSNAFTLTSNPTTSSSSMASKGSSILQSVKSGISSLLSRNKSKQAKTVVKAKNSKAKSNKPKSPK